MAPYKTLLQNVTAILLQNVTEVYYKICQVFYYKMWQFNYKMWQLLQNVMFATNCNSILMLLVYKKTYQEIIKIKITKNFINIVCFFNRNTPT